MSLSTAISLDRVSRVVGYKIKKGNFGINTPYLPMRIAILGEANVDNQTGLTTEPFEFINAQEVGKKYGYGSPLYLMARILRPISGNVLGGIVTEIYPQISDVTATKAVLKLGVNVTTQVSENATHTIYINGRSSLDGASYSFNVAKGEVTADVMQKIVDAINNVLGSPVKASINGTDIDIETKWAGATAKLDVEIDVNDKPAGITYSIVSNTDGTGAVNIQPSLDLFGEKWNTIVINPYGEAQFDTLEQFNGIPDPDNPTGRYTANQFKPFVALFGSTKSAIADIKAITDINARKSQVTNVLCPAPNSKAFEFEAAANMCITYALIANNTPHLGNGGKSYLDMPVPQDSNIGDFADYNARDILVKSGSSTVNLENGRYTVQDFVTTYHPDGEYPPKFRKVRDLIVDWNIAFGWLIIMKRDIQDKTLVGDEQPIRVTNTISPKQAKQLVFSYIEDRESKALLVDSKFSQDSVQVGINDSNPARLDVFFRYKRTSTADIVSTDVEVDFAFTI